MTRGGDVRCQVSVAGVPTSLSLYKQVTLITPDQLLEKTQSATAEIQKLSQKIPTSQSSAQEINAKVTELNELLSPTNIASLNPEQKVLLGRLVKTTLAALRALKIQPSAQLIEAQKTLKSAFETVKSRLADISQKLRASENPEKELKELENMLDSKFLENIDDNEKDYLIWRLGRIKNPDLVPIAFFNSVEKTCSSLIERIRGSKQTPPPEAQEAVESKEEPKLGEGAKGKKATETPKVPEPPLEPSETKEPGVGAKAVSKLKAAVELLGKGAIKLRIEEGKLASKERKTPSLLRRAMSATEHVGHSEQSIAAGNKLLETLTTVRENFGSLTSKERSECYDAIVSLEQNEWFKGYLSTVGKTNPEKVKQFNESKPTFTAHRETFTKSVKSLNTFSKDVADALKSPAGPARQQRLQELKKSFDKLQKQCDWKTAPKDVQEAYGSALRAMQQLPLLDATRHSHFSDIDSSKKKPLKFGGEAVRADDLKEKVDEASKDLSWGNGLRQGHLNAGMDQGSLGASVVYERSATIPEETQKYLLTGRKPSGMDTAHIPFGVKAGSKNLHDHGGYITPQEASIGAQVVGFINVKLSSVLSPGNSTVGMPPKLIGMMHDKAGNVEYVDAVVVSTAHADFERAGEGDARALALEDHEIIGSPFMPPLLTEDQRKDPTQVAEYDKKVKQHQVFLYTKSGKLPAAGDVKAKDTMEYAAGTAFLEKLITDGKSLEEIDKALAGKYLKVANPPPGAGETLYPMEMIFREYLEKTKTIFGRLEGGSPNGYTYSLDPPGEFAKLFGKDPRLITRMQTLSLKYLQLGGATFTNLKALGLSTYIAPSVAGAEGKDTKGLELLQNVIPQAVDKDTFFERIPPTADFKQRVGKIIIQGKEISLEGTVMAVNDLRDSAVFYGSSEKDSSTEGRLALTSDYALKADPRRLSGQPLPVFE